MITIKKRETYPEIKIGNLYKLRQDYHICDINGVRKKIDKNSIVLLIGLERWPKYNRQGWFRFKMFVDNSIRVIDTETRYQFINSTVKLIKNKNLEPKK